MIRFGLLIGFITLLFSTSKGQEMTYVHSPHYSFIENKGQWHENVLFQKKTEQGNLWIEKERLLFQIQDYSEIQEAHFSKKKKIKEELQFKENLVTLDFVGANPMENVVKKGKSKYYLNYFIGKDESKWASDVRGYDEFLVTDLYEGIDLRFIEQENVIKYEFIVASQTDPSQIRLRYNYADKIKINRQGELVVQTELGEIIEEKPYVYQIVNGKVIEIACQYKLEDNEVVFDVGKYNKRAALIIDPTLVFATYNGAVSDNFGMTATYGYDGTAYAAGTIYGNSHPIPDPNAYDTESNFTSTNVGTITTDAFITKYNADGTDMLWATFYGGGDNTQGTDVPHSLICDFDNNIYVFGTTSSTDFPIVNGFQPTFGGGDPISINYNGTNFGSAGTDIYAAKFSENGHHLIGSTYIGGEKNDGVNYIISAGNYNNVHAYDSLTMNYGDQFRGEIMLDEDNNILIGSCTRSTDFPTKNPFQSTIGGQQDGVVFKIKNDFSELLFSSYYGGSGADAIYSVKIDSSKNIVFGGGTTSENLLTTSGIYQTNYQGGEADGFVGKLSPDGLSLDYSTYVGTDNYDQVFFVEIDRMDNIFVYGQSNGGDFPVVDALYSNPNSSQFIAKLEPDLSGIQQSTIFGSGSSTFDLSPSAFMVDICGNIYLSGWGGSVLAGGTPMTEMPVTSNAFQYTSPNGFDFYLMVLRSGFDELLYATYLGGDQSQEHVDGGTSRFDKNGVIYQCVCGGCPGRSDFPTTSGAWSNENLASNCNALTFKFDFNLIPHADFTTEQILGCAPFDVQLNNFSSDSDSYYWDFGDGNLDSTTFEPEITYLEPGEYEIMLTVTDSVCLITDTAYLTVHVFPEIEIETSDDISVCEPEPITLIVNSFGTGTTFEWSETNDFSTLLSTDSTVVIEDPEQGFFYVKVSNEGCEKIDSIKVEFTSSNLIFEGETTMCGDETTEITVISGNPAIEFSNFNWSPSNAIVEGQNTSSITVQPSSTQYIYVTAEADNGCIVSDSIEILVSNIDPASVSATASEESVPEGGEVTLSAAPSGYDYSWSPEDGVAQPNTQETNAVVEEATTYTVEVSDGICTKSDTVTVKTFEFVCDEPFIYVPNAFTPNNDGDNDVLYVRSMIVEDIVFKVYNRWGEKVYETETLHDGWNGTFREKPMDPDVYDYYMEGHCIDGQEFIIKGNITLIR